MSSRRMIAFTLIELLVVVTTIAAAATLGSVGLARARWHFRADAEIAQVRELTRAIDTVTDPQLGTGRMIRTFRDEGYRVDPQSLLEYAGVSATQWTDPYRKEPISKHPVLGAVGLGLRDAEFPEGGRGRIYLDFVTKDQKGNFVLTGKDDPPSAKFGFSPGATYAIVSAGPDGQLDLEPHKDIVFIANDRSTLNGAGLAWDYRHR